MSDDLEELCKKLEAKLTAEEKDRAFQRMRNAGWRYGDAIPAWVWRICFEEVLAERKPDENPS